MHDTMTRAALIDEYQPLGLDECCKRLRIQGKNKDVTIEAWWSKRKELFDSLAKGFKKGMFVGNEIFNPDDVSPTQRSIRVESVTFTDLQGRKASPSTHGLLIKTERLSDGTVRSTKVLR
jgi:hypothetical protein